MNAIAQTWQQLLRLERPDALTSSGWKLWREQLAKDRPLAYLLGVSLPRTLSVLAATSCAPCRWLRHEWRTRVTERLHVVKTGLSPGYYDADRRMLHVNFQLLTDFVEIELAAIERAAPSAKRSAPRTSWPFGASRSREAGLARLGVLAQLRTTDEGPRPGESGERAPEALIAEEQEALYRWWTSVRPHRADPEAALTRSVRAVATSDDLSEADRVRLLAECDKADALQASYDEEDERNLIRLMRIRKSLWC